jgi:hypothetical protein
MISRHQQVLCGRTESAATEPVIWNSYVIPVYSNMMVRVAATRTYENRVAKLLLPESRIEMEDAIAATPYAHPVVSGGGIRVIYYFAVKPNIVLFITAYAKNEKDNLSNDDKKKIRQIVAEFQSTG